MKKNNISIITIFVFFMIISLTIGYSVFTDSLMISNTVSHVRVDKVVRINGVTSNSSAISNLDYSSKSILNTVYIPAGESVTYNATVTNLGNVPVAVSNVTFTSGGNTITDLSANISPDNYQKICENNNCINGVSMIVPITITNNSSSAIDMNLDVNLTFTEVYKIYYENDFLGEALKGSTYTYSFSSNVPPRLTKVSGECDNYNYTNGTLTITNVGSDLTFTDAYTITYNGEIIGSVSDGESFSKNLEPEFPASVTVESGSYDSYSYTNHVLSFTNVKSDIVVTGTIGKVEINNITFVSSKNVLNHSTPTFDGMDASFNVVFQRPEGSTETDFEIIYEVELKNNNYNDYIFRGFDFHPSITASASSDTATLTLTPIGITNGEVIKPETSKTFQVVLSLETNNPDGNYSTETTTQVDTTPDTEEETGTITASIISQKTGDLRSPNTLAAFTLEVVNTYTSDKTFSLKSSNSNLEIVNSSGSSLGELTIPGESSETYQIYVKVASGATFIQNTATLNLYLSTEGIANISVDTLTLNVDVYDVPDTTKVTVGNAAISYYYDKSDKKPKIKATWDRIDVGGTSIKDYVVSIYTANGNLVTTGHTNSSTREYLFSGLSENTNYYIIVYGIDEAENSGENDVSSATTSNGYATKSDNKSFKWTYTVNTNKVSNLAVGGDGSTAILGASHTITLTASGENYGYPYTAPENATVTMDGAGENFYTYTRGGNNNTVGTITINEVTGNISVSASRAGGCLIEGTKVLLANGKYKNIENINYDDLLLVYSNDTGEFVPEYPIWIEKGKLTDTYQRNTFSDGTILNTYNYHALYETKLKRFVSVDNPEEFHIGSTVAKMNKDGTGFDEVTVVNIEEIHEVVNYYQVISTRYFSIIANDLLTTDGTVELSNIYKFNDDITWNKEIHDEAIKDLFTYDDLKDLIPYYMYKGMRAGEAKVLINSGYDFNTFTKFVSQLTNDITMLRKPIQKFDKNMWMVTTSLDNVNELNKHLFLKQEGFIYTLPKINNIVSWFNTSDNKTYMPGDKVAVYTGMHFIANYGDKK